MAFSTPPQGVKLLCFQKHIGVCFCPFLIFVVINAFLSSHVHKSGLTTVDQPVHCQLSGSGNVLGLQNLIDIQIAQVTTSFVRR